MKNVYFIQPQYSVNVRDAKNYWMPYSVACLWSYCKEFDDIKESYELKDIVFKREEPEHLLNRLEDPVVCAFSCYLWNEQYNLHVAKLIKEKYPECIIEFGGPQVTTKMMDENAFIDCVLLGEGEEAFLKLLRDINSGNKIDKVHERQRLNDLEFKSPYQSGVFDWLSEKNPEVIWAAILETNRGCPHRCTFCDWGGTTMSKISKFGLERVADDIEWIRTNRVAYVLCSDANFAIFKERDIEIAKMLRKAAENSLMLDNIDLQYSKNSNEAAFEIAQIMGEYSRRGVTLSVQSMNMPTLKAIKRKNLHVKDIAGHINLAKKYGVNLYTDLILGMPEETVDSWKDGIDLLMENGQHYSVDSWFCQVFENAELGSEFSRKTYGIETVKAEDYISFCNDEFDDTKEYIELIRATDTMTEDEFFDAHMFSWITIKFHYVGYTQILSKYCRHVLGMSYRKFYELLYDYTMNDAGFLGIEFREYLQAIREYFTTGKVPKNHSSGHGLGVGMPNDTLSKFENKEKIFDFIKMFVDEVLDIDEDVFDIQKKFMYDPNIDYPCASTLPFDLDTWDKKDTNYTIENERTEEERYNLFVIRRKNLTKNTLIKL
jgi:radical SAM superfamily enzyme